MSDFEPLEAGSTELMDVDETLAAWRESDQHAHIVQFYEDDDFLVTEVSRFIGTALGAGDCGIVIATKAHRDGIAQRLASNGLNMTVAIAQGRYVTLDAAETLAKFMIAGQPDQERFNSVIGEVVERARRALAARARGWRRSEKWWLYCGRKEKETRPSDSSSSGTHWRRRTLFPCTARTR